MSELRIFLCPSTLGEVSLTHSLTHCVWICRVSVLFSKWQERRNCCSYPLNPRAYTHYYVHTHTPPILNLVPASHLVRTWSSYAICPPILALIHPTNTPITLIKPRVQQKKIKEKERKKCTVHTQTHTPSTMRPTCAGVEWLSAGLVQRSLRRWGWNTWLHNWNRLQTLQKTWRAFILRGWKLWFYVARLWSHPPTPPPSKPSVYIITID